MQSPLTPRAQEIVTAHANGTVRNVAVVPEQMALVAIDGPREVGAELNADSNLCSVLTAELDVDEVRFVQWDNDPIARVTNAFDPVPILRIVVELNNDTQTDLYRVVVADEDLEEAFGDARGIRPRLVAMLTDCDVELVTPEDLEKESARTKEDACEVPDCSYPTSATVGRLILHRFNGDEEFLIQVAAIRDLGEGQLWLEAETRGACIKTLADTAKLRAWPKAEVTIQVESHEPDGLVGTHYSVPQGYDDESDETLATFCYVEHEDLDDNEVDILSQDGDRFRVRWIGTTCDVNHYDGSKPPTRVEIDALFTFLDMARWARSGKGEK